MLETNLNMLKEEFNRQRDFQQASPSEQDSSREPVSYVSFQNGDDRPDQNPFKSDDSDDEYDASGKNPFAEWEFMHLSVALKKSHLTAEKK